MRNSSPLPQLALTWFLALVLGLMLLAAALPLAGIPLGGRLGALAPGARRAFPAMPADAAARPFAAPRTAPAGTGGYAVLEREDDGSGRPVRWDPCRPIHYVIRPDGAPPGGQVAVGHAVAMLSSVTGLRFDFDGFTDERPVAGRRTVQARYGDRWAPVLVAWTDPAEYPAMSGYAGLGGPDAVSGRVPGMRRYVSGVVLLNRQHLDQVARWPGGQVQIEAVVLHEFGHLAGLDHVADPGELMYRQPTPKTGGYAPGDLRGLARLSRGTCYHDF